MRKLIVVASILALMVGSIGCGATGKGAGIGAGTGALIGGIIGHQSGNTATGAIIGAAVGGSAGAIIGGYMDRQAEELNEDLNGATIERVGEGIKITFDSGILFDVNKSDLRPVAQSNLQSMATILNKYPDTEILIEGHTDSDGTDAHNQTLSESRASSVKGYLVSSGVAGMRMTTVGYGESQPVADNSTAAGKQANRRVEVAIMANDKLKKQAEKQASQG
ncbi:MAG: OmpA family protein [Gemmatimonadetes bacterium]|nr:OmpA family protein [Gemmatimonadota bacterium]